MSLPQNQTTQIQPVQPATATPVPPAEPHKPRPLAEIIKDLSRKLNPQRLATKTIPGNNGKQGFSCQYLPWHQCVQYLDNYAPGWSYRIISTQVVGDNFVMTVSITIVCAEGEVTRDASALEPIVTKGGFGDCATNVESAALRRAAAKFGLALYLYEK